MEVDNDSNSEEAQQSQSLLNTEYNQLIGNKDANSSDSDDYELTSYQKATLQVPPNEENEGKKKHLKRKASEVPDTTEAKIKKTEESIRLLKNHLQRNTCLRPLKYSAWANIPADEQFKKDVKGIKQKAERGFVEALTRFYYRRLEIQKKKLNKEMSMANRKGRKDNKNVNVSTTKDRNEIEALASKLKEQYDYLMSKLDNVTENKNCKKYSYVSVKCLNNTTGGSNATKGKSFSKKYKGKLLHSKKEEKSQFSKCNRG